MKQFFAERKLPFSWQRIGFVVGIVFVTLVLLMGIFVSGVYWYNDKVLPGVHIGEIAVGGMKKEELRSFIESMNDKFVGEGVPKLVGMNFPKTRLQSPPPNHLPDAALGHPALDAKP